MKKDKKYSDALNIKIGLKTTVYEEAQKRISFLFDEFEQIMVAFSGGKDSTIVFELAYAEAKKRNRFPLKVMFIDQEAEWLATIEMVKSVMERPGVEPVWIQCPFVLFNATSFTDHWLKCWDPNQKEKWVRPQEEYSKKENIYGTERFGELFNAIVRVEFGDKKGALIGGVRAEESPIRAKMLTRQAKYKWVTWAKILDSKRQHFTFYPVYDWSYRDVWKAIHDNEWKYCTIYDKMYQYGVSLNDMRVSNLHHETAVRSLFILQELEPTNYNRIVARIGGIDMAGKMKGDLYCPSRLPFMFKSWTEYRDYLIENLLDPEWQDRFHKHYINMDKLYRPFMSEEKLCKLQISSVLTNDWEFLKIRNPQVPKERYYEFKAHRAKLAEERKQNGKKTVDEAPCREPDL